MNVLSPSIAHHEWHKGFVLNWETFRPGDIILSRHSKGGDDSLIHALKSRIIRIFTKGKYSHAMLYFPQTIIHAVPPGVFSTNPQRLIAAHEDDFCVLRYPKLSDTECGRIEQFARQLVGTLYHFSALETVNLLYRWRLRLFSNDDRQFCSRLVAQAYKAANIEIANSIDFCAPGDFLKSSCLRIVENATREAETGDLRLINSHDFVKQNLDNTFKWLETTRECAKSRHINIQTISDAIEFAIADGDADAVIAKAIETSGYLSDWKEEKKAHLFRYNPCELLMVIMAGTMTLGKEILAESEGAYRHCLELIKFAYVCKQSNCKTAKLHLGLYLDLVNDYVEKLNTLAQVTMLSGQINYDVVRLRMLCEQVLDKNGLVSFNDIKKELDRLMHDIQSCAK